MAEPKKDPITPSEFYRNRRPEYFSDSLLHEEFALPREVMAFELDRISSNQKQDLFETLGRRLCEKFIAPNLIPQVGPTGGGDGKTDTETHAVSEDISDRWFIPKNGWENDEKWAFAISARKEWRSKAKSDIQEIIGTKRGYTKIFFISNQLIPARNKKQAQDEWKQNFGVEIVILDAEWILEKIYSNDLIDLACETLNLSQATRSNKKKLGPNDTERLQRLEELENQISDPSRYSENDHQLVEDALDAALLSRYVERPKDEVIGKFDRAIRLADKHKNPHKQIRAHYQKTWTLLHWYDDYGAFFESYKFFRLFINEDSNIGEVELFNNLFSLLRVVSLDAEEIFKKSGLNVDDEKKALEDRFQAIQNDTSKPAASLHARAQLTFLHLMEGLRSEEDPTEHILSLQECIKSCTGLLDFPFTKIQEQIEIFGEIFSNNKAYDTLFDMVAKEAEARSSQLAAGNTYFKRAEQKLSAKLYKEAIIYFGKTVIKFAKQESKQGLYIALKGLGYAYRKLGLLWVSNHCYIVAADIAFKSWYHEKKLDPRVYAPVKELVGNELFIGRIPSFLEWFDLLSVLKAQLKPEEEDLLSTLDGCMACRLSVSGNDGLILPGSLPAILNKHALFVAEDSALYQLGYIDELLKTYSEAGYDTVEKIDEHFAKMAIQPFIKQMRYKTNLMNQPFLHLESVIIGCKFSISFEQEKKLVLAAEMLLALFESFLATWLDGIHPVSETIQINLSMSTSGKYLTVARTENTAVYDISINLASAKNSKDDSRLNSLLEFVGFIMHQNFYVDGLVDKLTTLFKEEEVSERIALIFEHSLFATNILGDSPRILYKDWMTDAATLFPNKRSGPVILKQTIGAEGEGLQKGKPGKQRETHDQLKVISIIDKIPWEEAGWRAVGSVKYAKIPFAIFLAFDNEAAAKKIFAGWVERFGREDKNEQIRVALIKGINREHPHWYRVHIGSQLPESSDKSFLLASRMHTMNAESTHNLDTMISFYEKEGGYILCPGVIMPDNLSTKPFIQNGIYKRELIVRNAWEIGPNDPDAAAISIEEYPVIPDYIRDAPVFELLNKKQRM